MKLIIFGATGMIGHRIWIEAKKVFPGQVLATTRSNKERLYRYPCFSQKDIILELDVADWDSVHSALEFHRPDWIINVAGITLRKPEIKDTDRVIEVNSLFPKRLEKWCEEQNKKLVHISTDCVFRGESACYSERSIPSANDLYGKSKFLGEVTGANVITLRFSCIGRELEGKTELLEWFLNQDGKTIKGYANAIYSGLTNIAIAREVMKIVTHYPNLTGLYQLAGDPISKYELLLLLKTSFGYKTEVIADESYICDKTLLMTKYFEKTGFSAPPWKELVQEIVNDEFLYE